MKFSKEQDEVAAHNLYVHGCAALDVKDYEMSLVLLGVAEKLWEWTENSESAAKAKIAYEKALEAQRDSVSIVTRQVRAAVHASVFNLVIGHGDGASFILEKDGSKFKVEIKPSS